MAGYMITYRMQTDNPKFRCLHERGIKLPIYQNIQTKMVLFNVFLPTTKDMHRLMLFWRIKIK